MPHFYDIYGPFSHRKRCRFDRPEYWFRKSYRELYLTETTNFINQRMFVFVTHSFCQRKFEQHFSNEVIDLFIWDLGLVQLPL
jgi:hypothetical protein